MLKLLSRLCSYAIFYGLLMIYDQFCSLSLFETYFRRETNGFLRLFLIGIVENSSTLTKFWKKSWTLKKKSPYFVFVETKIHRLKHQILFRASRTCQDTVLVCVLYLMHCAVLGLFSLRLLETITRYVCKQTDNIFTDQTRMLVKNLTLLSTKCSLLRCIRESWRSNHVRPFSVSVEPATEFFQLSSGDKLAYKKTSGSRHPGVMFMPGLLANMTGEKARILEQYCSIHNHPFIRYIVGFVENLCRW